MHQVVLSIGGNLGDREQLIKEAIDLLDELCTPKAMSSLYETEAWGNVSDGNYLNQVLVVLTEKAPMDFLGLTQKIENKLGRTRSEKWGSRTMDIDLIYFDDMIYQDENLIIPHPLMSERKFVLVPLVEIMPDFIHPVFQISNQELLLRCRDESEVMLYRSGN
ncbi:MAG: 2-amino-4-hydroxy-6-hydroxymethyldihydropteridine diphosphokinase [Anditalea sp.]